MPHHKRPTLLALCTAAAFTGCTTPKHTDLLVFGTNTQFGVSMTGDTTTPGVNIGFKRQELVLMPLYVNGQESKLVPTTGGTGSPDNKYTGTDGNAQAKTDTYSVLASFGAKGSAKTTGSADVGIAQYFATGLAARTLAYAGGALINTSDKAADSAKDTSEAAARAQVKAVTDEIATKRQSIATLREKILAHAGTLPDAELKSVVDAAKETNVIPGNADLGDAAKQRAALKKYVTAGDLDDVGFENLKKLTKALSL